MIVLTNPSRRFKGICFFVKGKISYFGRAAHRATVLVVMVFFRILPCLFVFSSFFLHALPSLPLLGILLSSLVSNPLPDEYKQNQERKKAKKYKNDSYDSDVINKTD